MTLRARRHWLRLSCATVVALSAAAGTAAADDLKIGFFAPMSGAAAVYGTDTRRGADFALAALNKSGLLGANHIKLVVADTMANPSTAAQAVQRMVDEDEVLAVIGGATSAETAAAIEVTRAAEVPQLSPLANDGTLTKDNNKWFARIAQSTDIYAKYTTQWIIGRQHAQRVFLMARNDNLGQSYANAMEPDLKAAGGDVVGRINYDPTVVDFKPLLARLADSRPDFVAILGFYSDSGLIVKQIAEMGMHPRIFALSAPAIPQFRAIAGPAANGVYGALYYLPGSIDTPVANSFRDAWRATYGRDPTQYEGMGYDAINVMADALRRAGGEHGVPGRAAIEQAIHAVKDFHGATGDITILPNGDAKRPLPFVELRDGKLVLDFLAE